MLAQLRMARADQTYDRRLLRFTAPDLLIIDDLGLRPLQHDEPLDLYEVIRQRYERGALIHPARRNSHEGPARRSRGAVAAVH
ncbi:IstB-like ATP binding protein [Nannocystis exedens]|uniref:IstB-like ATP binding protein n=1 Tax=Nannocystis exedens TaxID=54 RepID=A0A1I2IQF3_9BACT|nr:transposase [Nannocystis exedens]SFF42751.1 IstB-like ATP binding protein [Nannocystis exedens]